MRGRAGSARTRPSRDILASESAQDLADALNPRPRQSKCEFATGSADPDELRSEFLQPICEIRLVVLPELFAHLSHLVGARRVIAVGELSNGARQEREGFRPGGLRCRQTTHWHFYTKPIRREH